MSYLKGVVSLPNTVFLVVSHSGTCPDDADVSEAGFCYDAASAEAHRNRLQDLANRQFKANDQMVKELARFRKKHEKVPFRIDGEVALYKRERQIFLDKWAVVANEIRVANGLEPFVYDSQQSNFGWGWDIEGRQEGSRLVSWSVRTLGLLESVGS